MPGFNTSGKPQTDDYNLGRGKFYFSLLNSSGLPNEWRDLGNAPEFTITVETEKLKHQSSREGLKLTDKEVVVTQEIQLSVSLDELNFENLALFFSGETSSRFNQGGSAITGNSNITVTKQGVWLDLYEGAAGQPTSDILSKRIYDIGVVTIDPAGGGSALVENTDFEVDSELGRIFVIEGGDMVAGSYDLDLALNASAADTVHTVKALTQSAVEGALKFVGENPADADRWVEYNFHKVALSAEGDLAGISDEWGTVTLTGTAGKNVAADPDSPYLTLVTEPLQA